MHRLIAALAVCLLLFPTVAPAQANAVTVTCEKCRDPIRYPDDYVNFAFNQIFGDQGWMNPEQADDFFIENPDGARVYVDVDFVMRGFTIIGFDIALWPEYLVHIRVALPNGLIIDAIRSIFLTPLPVPAPSAGGFEEPESTGNESGEEGVDEDDETELEEPEEPEWGPVGTTGIQDPDEDGNFPDADWCEEC